MRRVVFVRWLGTLVLLAAMLGAGVVSAEAKSKAKPKRPRAPHLSISVLSGRPGLVSGGSALVAISPPNRRSARRLKITLGRRNVTRAFAYRADGGYEGLVSGLRLGKNVLRARLPNGWSAQLTLIDHPASGPVFSGPQLHPWICQKTAVDRQCNEPVGIQYLYMSSSPAKSGFQPYDPHHPASDVATTTTDQGVTVPFIVKVETGYMDRDQYQIAVLYQPGLRRAWTPFTAQPQWDHKLLITHGAFCGDDRTTGRAPATVKDGAGPYALGKGFMIMSTALDNSGHNCNIALQAESLVMAKEHIVKSYGTVRYTIGTGCSGGSLAEQWIANAYPGVYQGILPTCSFPDAWSTATQFFDYHLLLAYFKHPGSPWLPTQENDVLAGAPDGLVNANVSESAQFHVAVPTDTCSGVTDAQRYDPVKNPGGVRCTITDAAINVFGPEPRPLWSANEQRVGHGFARDPVDNIGVEYGLAQLKSGEITPAQFDDVNHAIGGVDIDTNPTPNRVDATGSPSLARAYRSGMINEANNLDQVAIIDCRGPNPGLFHDAYRAFSMRARLDRAHGTHANQLIWEGSAAIIGDTACEQNSFIAMDRWLTAVERDRARTSLPGKIIQDKPSDLTDECWSGAGQKLSDGLCPPGVVNVEATPRMEAGDAITTDDNKCQLKPLRTSDFPGITFTTDQWATLQKAFPTGVCDFSKSGVDQQPTVPWMTYQDARGRVIYGGRPLGAIPASTEVYAAPRRRR